MQSGVRKYIKVERFVKQLMAVCSHTHMREQHLRSKNGGDCKDGGLGEPLSNSPANF